MSYTYFDAEDAPQHGRLFVQNLAANGSVLLPKGCVATKVTFRNDTANAVTGGVKVGTTSGGVDVLAAGAVAASVLGIQYDALKLPALATDTTLFIQAVTAWNGAIVDVVVDFTRLI